MKKSNIFKIAALTAVFAVSGMFANAQTTSGDIAPVTPQVKLIDNKGTIKYLQVVNGLTMLTNTTNNLTTTTWQLGGVLTNNTYITVGDNKAFVLDGLKLETGTASTDATGESNHGTGSGWTVLVRDENTGETKKMLASDFLQVQSGHKIQDVSVNKLSGETTIDMLVTLPSFKSVYVYRNGAKLTAGIDAAAADGDYYIDGQNVKIKNDVVPFYALDRIEVHFIK